MSEVAKALVEAYGVPGLLIFVIVSIVFLVLSGRLWPKGMVDARLKDKQDIIANQQVTLDKLAATQERIADNQEDLLENTKTTVHLLQSIKGETKRADV